MATGFNYSITVGGYPINGDGITTPAIKAGSFHMSDITNERSTLDFTVFEATGGLWTFVTGQYVQVQDISVTPNINIFTGRVHTCKRELVDHGTNMTEHEIACVDLNESADRRVAIKAYSGYFAGDILSDLAALYMVTEGIQVSQAYARYQSYDQFVLGTGTNVVPTANNNGDIELQAAGTDLVYNVANASDWNASGVTQQVVSVVGNTLQIQTNTVLKVAASCTPAANANSYFYNKICTTPYTIVAGDYLVYDIWVPSDNAQHYMGLDGHSSTGTIGFLRDYKYNAGTSPDKYSLTDQNGLLLHPGTDLSGYTDQWYTRYFPLYEIGVGSVVDYFMVACESDNQGDYRFYIRNARIASSTGSTQLAIFTGTLQQNINVSAQCYYNISLTTMQAYNQQGVWTSPVKSMSSIGIMKTSFFSINYDMGNAKADAQFYTSVDQGLTYYLHDPSTQNDSVPGVVPGLSVNSSDMGYRVKIVLNNNNTDPIYTPIVYGFQSNIRTSYRYNGTGKQDVVNALFQSTDWSGTGTTKIDTHDFGDRNLTLDIHTVDLKGTPNITTYGVGSSVIDTGQAYQGMRLRSGTAAQGQTYVYCADIPTITAGHTYTVSVDIPFPPQNQWTGLIYNTAQAAFSANKGCFAYAVVLFNEVGSNIGMKLVKGQNNSAGGAITTISTNTTSWAAGTMLRLRIEINGSSHLVYVDGALYMTVTDSTYTTNAKSGLILASTDTLQKYATYQNLVCLATTPAIAGVYKGTWTSADNFIQAAGTYQTSIVGWGSNLPFSTAMIVESSINSGSTWQLVSNGGVVNPNLTVGQSLSGVQVRFRVTLTTLDPTVTPTLTGITYYVLAPYSTSGTWISSALVLTPIPRAGNATISWQPGNIDSTKTLNMFTSTDGGSTYQSVTAGSTIPNLSLSPTPFIDNFTTDDIAGNYTQLGTFTNRIVDEVNYNLTMDCTSSATIKYTNYGSYDSAKYYLDFTEAEGLGLLAGYGGGIWFYVTCNDDHTANPGITKNTIVFEKWAASTQYFSVTVPFELKRGDYHRLIIDYFDGICTVTINGKIILNQWVDPYPPVSCVGGPRLVNGTGSYPAHGVVTTFAVMPYGNNIGSKTIRVKANFTSTDPDYTPYVSDLNFGVRPYQIDAGPVVNQATFNYAYVSDCIRDLVSRSNFWSNIDADGVLWYKGGASRWAPVIVHGGNIIGLPKVTFGNPLYRNYQWVVGGKNLTSEQNFNFVGNGYQTSWNANYPLAQPPRITVNNVVKTVGISGVDGGKDFYWQLGSTVISQDTSGVILKGNSKMLVKYVGYYDTVVKVVDTGQVQYTQNNEGFGTGIVEEVTDGTNILTLQASYDLANGLMSEFCVQGQQITFRTLNNSIKPGMMITVYLPQYGITETQFVVEKVDVTDDWPLLYFDVQATNGPLTGSWERAIGKLSTVSSIANINLGTGTIVSNSLTFSEGIAQSESVTYTIT